MEGDGSPQVRKGMMDHALFVVESFHNVQVINVYSRHATKIVLRRTKTCLMHDIR